MSKKSFKQDIITGADRFFSVHDAKNTRDIQNTENIKDAPDVQPEAAQKPASYRINLKLRGDHKDFLADEAWRQRLSVTELINRMIDEYKAKTQVERQEE